MKKSELLKHIPSELPKENSAKIIKTPGRKALMILLPGWQVMGRESEDYIIHFTWKDGYLTYYPKSKEWTRHKYTTLYYNSYVSGGGFDEKGLKAIMAFTGRTYAHGAIENYERDIDWAKREKALDNKQKRIDRKMKDVPALPKDFKRFCTRKLKESGEKKINIKLFQPHKGRMMERIFTVSNYMGPDKIYITEICRAYQRELAGGWIEWYYGEYHGRSGRRQQFWDKKRDSCVNNLPLRHYVYDNLDSIDLSPAEKDTLRLLDGKCDPTYIIRKCRSNPQIEYIAKKGCLRLAVDLVNNYGVKELKISNAIYKRLRECDGGMEARELLEVAPRITDKYLKEFCKVKDRIKASMIIGLAKEVNINHVYTLLLKTGGMTVNNIKEYEDYLRMAQRLGNNPSDEIIYRNKNWHEWHTRYADEIGKRELITKNKTENKKFKNISTDYKINKSLFSWEDENYLIIVPKNAAEINEEGRKQHHCVGAQPQYKERMCNRKSFIVFLRKKKCPDMPYYTIECDLQRVIQFYAAYDRQPDKEKVQKVLNRWMKQVKKNSKELSKAAG